MTAGDRVQGTTPPDLVGRLRPYVAGVTPIRHAYPRQLQAFPPQLPVSEQQFPQRSFPQMSETALHATQRIGRNHRACENQRPAIAMQHYLAHQGVTPKRQAESPGLIRPGPVPALAQHPDTEAGTAGGTQTRGQRSGFKKPGSDGRIDCDGNTTMGTEPGRLAPEQKTALGQTEFSKVEGMFGNPTCRGMIQDACLPRDTGRRMRHRD